MDTSVKPLEGISVELSVTVPAEEVSEAVNEAYSRVASQLRIPGFRPGRAPRPIVDGRVGKDAVLSEARDQLAEDTYPEAINAEGLRPIAPPEFDELAPLVEGEPFTYTAKIEIRPSLTLSTDDPIVVTVPSSATTEAEIDAQLANARERYATLEPVERAMEPGDFALVSFVGLVDGAEYEGNVVDKYLYESGRGLMPAEFDAAIMGVKAGGKGHAEFAIPESSAVPEFVGRTATFDIEVHEVKAKVLPELDDEFAATVGGFESLDELRADLKTRMDDAKQVGHTREIERSARAMLAERLVGDVPDSMIDYRANALTEEFFETLEQRQISIEDYISATGVTQEQIKDDIKERARGVLAEELALEALFRQQGMEVADAQVEEEIEQMSGSEPGASDRMRERIRSAGMLPLIRETIMHRMATRWLMDNVEVIEVDPSEMPPGDEECPAD